MRTSTTSTEMPCSSWSLAAASRQTCSIRPYATQVRSVPSRFTSATPDRHRVVLVRDLALDQAVRLLVLEEQHGVRVADGRAEHALRVVRRRGDDDLQPGDVAVERLDRLRVVQRPVDAAAPRRADHQGAAEVAVGPVPDPGRLGHDLVERGMDEVGELDLGDGQQAVQGHPDGDPDDEGLGQRRVDDPLLAELLHEPLGDPEHAAARADVLAQDDDALVALHLVPEGVVDRGDDVLLGHESALRLGEHVPQGRLGVGVGRAPGLLDRGVDLGLELDLDLLRPAPRAGAPGRSGTRPNTRIGSFLRASSTSSRAR